MYLTEFEQSLENIVQYCMKYAEILNIRSVIGIGAKNLLVVMHVVDAQHLAKYVVVAFKCQVEKELATSV